MGDFISVLRSYQGDEILGVEVVSICHMLRLVTTKGDIIQIIGSWRIRSTQTLFLGALDMDFHVDVDEALVEEEDVFFTEKLSSLKGKKIKSVEKISSYGDVEITLTGGKVIEIFCLSKPGPLIMFRSED